MWLTTAAFLPDRRCSEQHVLLTRLKGAIFIIVVSFQEVSPLVPLLNNPEGLHLWRRLEVWVGQWASRMHLGFGVGQNGTVRQHREAELYTDPSGR